MSYGSAAEKERLTTMAERMLGVSLLLPCVGFALPLLLIWANNGPQGAFDLTGLFLVSGGCVWLIGCAIYAKSKGYSPLWGGLGVLFVLGLGILWALPDRWSRALALEVSTVSLGDLSNYPR